MPPARAADRSTSSASEIRQLQVDFERFFNGGLPLPPEELRNRIQSQLRNLRNTKITAPVETFRLGDLEARFNSYNEMFNRRLRDVEEGRGPHRVVAFVERQRFDPRNGVVLVPDRSRGGRGPLSRARLRRGGTKFDLDSFQTYLRRQTDAIRQKTGCEEVQFRVAEEDGKLKLKARPVPAR